MADLLLGRAVSADPATPGQDVSVATDDLVTHGLIVGMTGSGKTGLGIGLIEETLKSGVPALLFDPKGDLTNLALVFPSLSGADFAPWVDPAQAKAAGVSVEEWAAQQADAWRKGLEPWGIGTPELQAYKDAFDLAIYTPGSTAGIPLNVLGSLNAPQTDDSEAIADEIEGYVTSLLSIVGISADPLSSREHILLSNIIASAWAAGESIDLPTLLARVQQPPMRKLGVFELDQFFPPNDRTGFAMKLNGVLAAPTFQNWITGDPIDIQSMLYGPDGKPRCSIITTAHLSDEQRQSATSLILSKVVTWMRRQSGTTDLRALLYMDEVAGYLPPTGNPPTKKPIMLLMKQARAFGLGVVLSTQNPVDVDYKALSNAGTWLIGRLTTDQDRSRLLDGMGSIAGGFDPKAVGDSIASLGKRQFLLRKAGRNDVVPFGTKWVRSYLRGPMTRDQIAQVKAAGAGAGADGGAAAAGVAAAGTAAGAAGVGAGETVAAGVAAAVQPPTAVGPGVPVDGGVGAGAPVAAPAAAPAPTAAQAIAAQPAAAFPTASAPLADDETPVMPAVADGTSAVFLDPAAPWAGAVGAVPPTGAGQRLEAAAVARVIVRYEEVRAGLNHDEEYEAVVFPLPASTAVLEPIVVDYDDRDLVPAAPAGARYAVPDAKIGTKTYWTTLQRDLTDLLVRSKPIELFVNSDLKAYSRVGESEADFGLRCRDIAAAEADKKTAALKTKYDTKLRALQTKLNTAAARADQAAAARNAGMMSDVGNVLGGFFGGRRSTTAITAAARRASAANARAQDAAAKVDEARMMIGDVEAEFAAEVQGIADEWNAKADAIATLPISPKKTNVRVVDLRLVWLPVG